MTDQIAPLFPQRLTNTAGVIDAAGASGVLWKLDVPARGLDSNIIALRPGQRIDRHAGAEVDVLIHVLSGHGVLGTDGGPIDLAAGDLLWLPRRSEREFSAGELGLVYLTVHQHREPQVVQPTFPRLAE